MFDLRKTICAAAALTLLLSLSACGSTGADSQNDGPEITLSQEDETLLETLGDDVHETVADDFSTIVASLTADNVGQVWQLTGYYLSETDGATTTDYLCSAASDPDAKAALRYLYTELTEGDRYTMTLIVAQNDAGELVLDVVTVQSA